MQVAINAKFAACFFSRCAVRDDLPDEAEVHSGVWVARRLGVDIGEHWPQWIGSLATDEIREGGFALYVTALSQHPGVLDAENQALNQRRDDLLNGLLILGVPEFMQGFSISGANVDGGIQIRQYSRLREMQPTHEMPKFLIGLAEIDRTLFLAQRLRLIQDAGQRQWGRLLRGVRTLLNANRERNEHGDRLHQFMRALEALVKPRIAKTRSDFSHRSQTFAQASQETRETLLQLFDLRSAVEHLHLAIDAVAGSEPDRIALVNRRTRQADALARFALLRVLESEALFETFRTDDQIDRFWRMKDGERLAVWGDRLDLVAIH